MFIEADRLAVANAAKLPPRFSRLLVTGFDGAHWPLWPLLNAAVKSSQEATVVLNDPRDEARDIDETWVGTWEEIFGAAEPAAEANSDGQPEKAETARTKCIFLVGADATEQARAIVALTAKFLCENDCERIGILFPQKGALPRLVARFLRAAQIAHNDAIAHLTPSVFDDDAWRAWLELQKNPQIKISFSICARGGRKDFRQDTGSPDAKKNCATRTATCSSITSKFCAKFAPLRRKQRTSRVQWKRSSFCQRSPRSLNFFGRRKRIFAEFGWKQHWSEVERLSRGWADRVPQSLLEGELFGLVPRNSHRAVS